MAKGSAMGLWRGKKGSSVFYKIANSNSAQKQGIRERNYEPQNPQTSSQAGQRMRMYPAQAVYGAIKEVIQRSWQGTKYGEDARREYLKRALSNPVFPAVEKNMGVIVPGPYQIAKGSLQEITCVVGTNIAMTDLRCADFATNATIGSVSQSLLDSNSFLKEGDQISIIVCSSNRAGEGFYWEVCSFIIDTSNIDEVETLYNGYFSILGQDAGLVVTTDDASLYAVGVILSREGSTPLRSSATLACNYTVGDMPNYYSNEAVARAKASYMKKSTERTNSDWPADPSGDGSGGGSDAPYFYITVQADPSNGGQVTSDATEGRVANGDSVTVQATVNPMYSFTGWYVGDTRVSSSNQYTFFPSRDTTLVAKFVREEEP